MQQPAPTAADHAAHDRMAVAAYAAGDATGPGLTAATALVVTCPECASLHRDLRAIAAALPATAAPLRPRDFRITPGQAATLRPAGWRRILAPFAGPGFAFAGPLGSGLATLGLAGILVAGAAGLPLGGASSASAPVAGGGEVQATAPALAPGIPGPESSPTSRQMNVADPSPASVGPEIVMTQASPKIAPPAGAGATTAPGATNASGGGDTWNTGGGGPGTGGTTAGVAAASPPADASPAAVDNGPAFESAPVQTPTPAPGPGGMLLALATIAFIGGGTIAGLRWAARRLA